MLAHLADQLRPVPARFPEHRDAKGHVRRWYDGYRVVVSEIKAQYGDGSIE